jgi:hypothetical protein
MWLADTFMKSMFDMLHWRKIGQVYCVARNIILFSNGNILVLHFVCF